jgi:hypothetical protein
MSRAPLPENDCHHNLRKQVIEDNNIQDEELCISVAWDWMFRGLTPRGINREVSTILEATILNRKHGKVSLAIPELSLLQMARIFPPPKEELPDRLNRMIKFDNKFQDDKPKPYEHNPIHVCRGILPGLRHVANEHFSAMDLATDARSKSLEKGERVTVAKRPNTHENPGIFPVDPYGNSDFICKLCSKELSNVYFHCDGCERLLSKDFNICQKCHTEKNFLIKVQMHPLNSKSHSTINHTGTYDESDERTSFPCLVELTRACCCSFIRTLPFQSR